MQKDQIIKDLKTRLDRVKEYPTQDVALTVRSRCTVQIDALVTVPDIKRTEDGSLIALGRGIQVKVPDPATADTVTINTTERYPVYNLTYGNTEIEYIFLSA